MRFRSKYFRLDESAGNAVRAHTHGHQTWCEFFSFFSALLPCGVENEPAKLGTPPFKTRQTPQGERLEYQSYLRNAGQIVPHSLEVLTVQSFASRHEFVVILKRFLVSSQDIACLSFATKGNISIVSSGMCIQVAKTLVASEFKEENMQEDVNTRGNSVCEPANHFIFFSLTSILQP